MNTEIKHPFFTTKTTPASVEVVCLPVAKLNDVCRDCKQIFLFDELKTDKHGERYCEDCYAVPLEYAAGEAENKAQVDWYFQNKQMIEEVLDLISWDYKLNLKKK